MSMSSMDREGDKKQFSTELGAKREEGNDCAHSITSNLQPLPAATLT